MGPGPQGGAACPLTMSICRAVMVSATGGDPSFW